MNWLREHLTREGPGIRKDAPKKQGLALFGEIVRREWWELLQLNLLYVLFALPVVTLPAAHAAATRISVSMVEDRNSYLLRDFWEAFRSRFWRATVVGWLCLAVAALAGYAAFVFLQAARGNLFLAVPLAMSAATLVFVLIAGMHAFALMAMRELPLGELVRLSLLGALARPLPPLAALGVIGMLWLVHVIFYPVSVFMPAVLNFSIGTLVATFSVHKAAVSLLSPGMPGKAGRAGAGGSTQMRVR